MCIDVNWRVIMCTGNVSETLEVFKTKIEKVEKWKPVFSSFIKAGLQTLKK